MPTRNEIADQVSQGYPLTHRSTRDRFVLQLEKFGALGPQVMAQFNPNREEGECHAGLVSVREGRYRVRRGRENIFLFR